LTNSFRVVKKGEVLYINIGFCRILAKFAEIKSTAK